MRIAICDTLDDDRNKLKNMIEEYDNSNHIGFIITEYVNGSDVINKMESGAMYDMIFVDFNLEDMNGLMLAKKIREIFKDVPIILISALMDHALDGYKVRANRFLFKENLDSTFTECMDDICEEIRQCSKTILLSCVEGEIRFNISEIMMLENNRHKCIIHLTDRYYHIYEKLDTLETMLKRYGFLRIHQSYLVNMQYIRNINNYVLTLQDGTQLSIPKARFQQVKQDYISYIGKMT